MTAKIADKQRKVTKTEVPSFDAFRQEIMKIYPAGDLTEAYEKIFWYIEREKICADGTPISYRLIMDKFAAHIRAWNMRYGSREPKFIGKADEEKRKDLLNFIYLKWYEQEFVPSAGQGERNKYLFGAFPVEYLKQQLDEFKRKFPNETGKSTG
jgi:hypothetical protein